MESQQAFYKLATNEGNIVNLCEMFDGKPILAIARPIHTGSRGHPTNGLKVVKTLQF